MTRTRRAGSASSGSGRRTAKQEGAGRTAAAGGLRPPQGSRASRSARPTSRASTCPAWTCRPRHRPPARRRLTPHPGTDGSPVNDGAATADPQIIFTPSGRRGRATAGTTVLDAARALGVDIDSVCGGRGICGRCAVVPAFGAFAKHGITSSPDHLSAPGEVEAGYRAEHGLAEDRRLSCTAILLGDAVVDVPPESQVHKQVVRKDLAARAFEMDPVVRLHTVDVTEPDLATPTGDLGRLFDALREEWQLDGLRADLSVIRGLQDIGR